MRKLLLIVLFACAAGLFAQASLPKPLKYGPWQLANFLPGKGTAVTFSGEWQGVQPTRSINELIDAGLEFKDSFGRRIASNQVEYHYWRYRAYVGEGRYLKRKKYLYLKVPNPEPLNFYSVGGQSVAVSYSNNIPVSQVFKTAGFQDMEVYLDVQIPSLFDAGVLMLKQAGNKKWPADNDTAQFKTSAVLRKPPVQFGWDIAERKVLGGLGAVPELYAFNKMAVLECQALQDKGGAAVRWLLYSDSNRLVQLNMAIKGPVEGLFHRLDTTVELKEGNNELSFLIPIPHPVLWQPGRGGLLYDFTAIAICQGDTFSTRQSLGFRKAELRQNTDSIGQEFRFVINGREIKTHGASVIAPQGFESEGQRAAWYKGPNSLLRQLHQAGYNMLRVWGGGGLMDEGFYNLCDSLGMLVWQDLMYSGTVYPYDGPFRKRTLLEAVAVAKRLRVHPSVVLYCGNNEIDVALKNWGWSQTHGWSKSDSQQMVATYRYMFNLDLPKVFAEADPNTPYLNSTPVSNWAPADEMKNGDNHLWFVWHGERPISDFDRLVPRFASEYGMPSWPSLDCVRRYFGKDKPESRMLSYKGLKLLNGYMMAEFGALPKDTQSFILLSQYLQSRALFRAGKAHLTSPACGGTLYWQLNDVWPGITWSSIDFAGNKKAAWFAMQNLFSGDSRGINLNLDAKTLPKPRIILKRKGDWVTVKLSKVPVMGLMFVQNGKLLDFVGNALDYAPGRTLKIYSPVSRGKLQITTVWHLLNDQGFLEK